MRVAVATGVCIWAATTVLLVMTTEVAAHGASRGLHLHVTPDPAEPGQRLIVEAEASEAISEIRVSIVEGAVVRSKPRDPSKKLLVVLKIPDDFTADSVSIHAEAVVVTNETVRASAIVRVTRRDHKTGMSWNASATPALSVAASHAAAGSFE